MYFLSLLLAEAAWDLRFLKPFELP